MKIPDKLYDILKWAWPYSEEIVTTITAVDTFFGAVLCISTATYNKEGNENG